MADTQHTPGPWVTKGPHIMEAGPSFNWVASVQVSNMPEWEANARLIAAAPDLLEALQDLLTSDLILWLPPWPLEGDLQKGLPPWSAALKPVGEAVLAARAAIAKATGQ